MHIPSSISRGKIFGGNIVSFTIFLLANESHHIECGLLIILTSSMMNGSKILELLAYHNILSSVASVAFIPQFEREVKKKKKKKRRDTIAMKDNYLQW